MATTQPTPPDPVLPNQPADERIRRTQGWRRLLRRPELGATVGAVLVWVFFAVAAGQAFISLRGAANYLEVAAELGILAIPVALLMISGEFDLSVGSMIGATGMITAILSVEVGWSIWAAMGASLVVALMLGAMNGVLVNRTGLPSFIITLGSLFIIRGATIGFTRLITGRTQVSGLNEAEGFASAEAVFASVLTVPDPLSIRTLRDGTERMLDANFPISILWWVVLAAVATWALLRTRPGNWIFGIGGDEAAARNVGVPVGRMRIYLFMGTAAAAWLVATIQILSIGSADTLRGELRELIAIAAVVIGGTLLTGGYGSVIGAVLGALIFGMVQQGIVFTGVDSDWFQVFLGGMLIIAVLANNYIRRRAAQAR